MLRRDHTSADRFPDDVLELRGYLGDESRVPGVHAYPGRGTRVPLYILGSSHAAFRWKWKANSGPGS